MVDPTRVGGRIGPKIASQVEASMVATRRKSAVITHQLAMQIQDTWFKIVSGELRRTVGGLFAKIATHPSADGWVRDTFTALSTQDGQGLAWLGQTIAGSAVSTGLGALLNNELAIPVQEIIAANPHSVLSPETVASMDARTIPLSVGHAFEAAKSGINSARYAALVDASHTPLDPGSILELFRRNILTFDSIQPALRRAGYRPEDAFLIEQLARVHITPEQAADMVVRGILTEAEGSSIARKSGIAPEDFPALVADSGDALDVTSLLEAYRRGFIDTARLRHGIVSGRLRNEWIDVVEKLRLHPMDPADAIRAVVQSRISASQGRALAEEGGLEPRDFDILIDVEGDPPGPETALDLYNRGFLTRAETEQALRESRLKNKYIPQMLDSAVRLPPDRTIVAMVRSGALSRARGLELLLRNGLERDLAVAMMDEASNGKTAKGKDLAVSVVQELYEARAVSAAAATDMLVAHGYDHEESAWLLSIFDLRRKITLTNQSVSTVRSQYLRYRISERDASNQLDGLHVAPDARDLMLDQWTIERNNNRPRLTEAQIAKALKLGILSPDEAVARWEQLGYTEEDTAILFLLVGGPR